MKLKKMYASVENMQNDQNLLRATTRRFTQQKGIVGPQDWYMKEFSRETLQYFKDNQRSMAEAPQFGSQVTKEIMDEHKSLMDSHFSDGKKPQNAVQS